MRISSFHNPRRVMRIALSIGRLVCIVAIVEFLPRAGMAQDGDIRITEYPSDAEEVTIAVNPSDPSKLIAVANLNYVYCSGDSGRTWQTTQDTSLFGVYGDPWIGYDKDGNAYYAHLSSLATVNESIVVARSTDNGYNWFGDVSVGPDFYALQDKEWLVIDRTNSPYRGTLYLSWTEFDNGANSDSGDSSRILFSRSTDHGASWSAPMCISTVSGCSAEAFSSLEGTAPVVGPDGSVYVMWAG